jgi:hypothetical protein
MILGAQTKAPRKRPRPFARATYMGHGQAWVSRIFWARVEPNQNILERMIYSHDFAPNCRVARRLLQQEG